VRFVCVVHGERLHPQRPVSSGDASWVHASVWVVGAMMALACGVAWLGTLPSVSAVMRHRHRDREGT
jgi:hypothetical protein